MYIGCVLAALLRPSILRGWKIITPLLMDTAIVGDHSGWNNGNRGTEREIQPFGYENINDYWGHFNIMYLDMKAVISPQSHHQSERN